MSAEEAYEFICQVSYSLGSVGVEQYSTQDGDKLREAARVLYLEERQMEYKLNCFGQWEDIARCGMCPDEGTCSCETKWKADQQKSGQQKTNKSRNSCCHFCKFVYNIIIRNK